MAHIKPEGSFVALITPFNKDGSIDEGAELQKGLNILQDLELDKKYGFQINPTSIAAE